MVLRRHMIDYTLSRPTFIPFVGLLCTTITTNALTMTTKKGIIMVLSPAKTLNLTPLSGRDFLHHLNEETISQIGDRYDSEKCDAGKTTWVSNVMKSKSEAELRSLLGLSASLSKVAHKFWNDFSHDPASADFRLAMFTFAGPAFQGLSPSTCDTRTLSYP